LQATDVGLQIGIQLLLAGSVVAGMWVTFEKAGEPGWAAIIPIYNTYLLVKIGDNAWWWVLLLFVPVINILALGKISIDVAAAFEKGVLFGLGLALLPFVCYPVLGFGGSQYRAAS
jgi:hypothetical protein